MTPPVGFPNHWKHYSKYHPSFTGEIWSHIFSFMPSLQIPHIPVIERKAENSPTAEPWPSWRSPATPSLTVRLTLEWCCYCLLFFSFTHIPGSLWQGRAGALPFSPPQILQREPMHSGIGNMAQSYWPPFQIPHLFSLLSCSLLPMLGGGGEYPAQMLYKCWRAALSEDEWPNLCNRKIQPHLHPTTQAQPAGHKSTINFFVNFCNSDLPGSSQK